MSEAIIQALRRKYMENIGNPAAQLIGGGVRGYLGLDMPEYADTLGREAYANAQALGNAPGIGAPAGAFKAAAKVVPEAAMFIGALAKTWDKASNAKAVQMEKAGKDAREIWRETGNLRGSEGKWRQEIPDNLAKYDADALAELKQNPSFNYLKDTQPMGGVLSHKGLYSSYPDLADVQTHFMPTSNLKGAAGSYARELDRVTLADVPRDQKSVAIHELQHAIQQREGWSEGGSTSAATWASASQRPELLRVAKQSMVDWKPATYEQFWGKDVTKEGKDAYAAYLKQWDSPDEVAKRWRAVQEGAPAKVYRNLAGEAEARATQARINMTPAERRAKFPYDSYDVPVDQLIIALRGR